LIALVIDSLKVKWMLVYIFLVMLMPVVVWGAQEDDLTSLPRHGGVPFLLNVWDVLDNYSLPETEDKVDCVMRVFDFNCSLGNDVNDQDVLGVCLEVGAGLDRVTARTALRVVFRGGNVAVPAFFGGRSYDTSKSLFAAMQPVVVGLIFDRFFQLEEKITGNYFARGDVLCRSNIMTKVRAFLRNEPYREGVGMYNSGHNCVANMSVALYSFWTNGGDVLIAGLCADENKHWAQKIVSVHKAMQDQRLLLLDVLDRFEHIRAFFPALKDAINRHENFEAYAREVVQFGTTFSKLDKSVRFVQKALLKLLKSPSQMAICDDAER